MFAARPGLRLWRSDIRGQVEDTRQLKPLFSTQVHRKHAGDIDSTLKHRLCDGIFLIEVNYLGEES